MNVSQIFSSQVDAADLARRVTDWSQPASRPSHGVPHASVEATSAALNVDVDAPAHAGNDAGAITGHFVAQLPPPQAPQAPTTPRTAAAFASLAASVSAVLETLSLGAPRIDWSALTPKVPSDLEPELAGQTAKTMATAAGAVVGEVNRQLELLNSHDMFVAFFKLRLEAHGHGLRINEQLAEMASSVRRAMLQQKSVHDREERVLVDRAVAQQVKLERTGVWLDGMTALATASLAVLLTTSGVGLALTVGAIGVGFLAGGVVGGQAHEARFDVASAFRGASVGALAVPLADSLAMILGALCRIAGIGEGQAVGLLGQLQLADKLAPYTPETLRLMGAQTIASFEQLFERYVLGIMQGFGLHARTALWTADPVMRSVSHLYRTSVNYRIANLQTQGRTAQNLGRVCAQAGREAQERWKNTTNFLSGMQESHNEAVEQVLRMLTMHHQMLSKVASYIR